MRLQLESKIKFLIKIYKYASPPDSIYYNE
jgi:hypothetical protein